MLSCAVVVELLESIVGGLLVCSTISDLLHRHRYIQLQMKLYDHFYNSAPVQRLLRGGSRQSLATGAGEGDIAPVGEQLPAGPIGAKRPHAKPRASGSYAGSKRPGSNHAPAAPAEQDVVGLAESRGEGGPQGTAQPEQWASGTSAAVAITASSGPQPLELSVLAAITAVKKLCCHPDLVSGLSGITMPIKADWGPSQPVLE
jgi:hypothetical protein